MALFVIEIVRVLKLQVTAGNLGFFKNLRLSEQIT